ncbi:acetyl-CoA C-acetyltransferase [Ilumatobacter fluminis]|uniref:Acetyl-CoA C-acetyltransferase n=1 Tax=Ilumatobacter fluminis TaxID=467091 RepID=A0A4R7HVD2_9ACTN|nr:acetyl-CoA acetyltransferase [Ilumatobacter fluminis]TDT14947.1 acetyl-CoA C-acetyltransferase [Ilumatobacter fluminis]
MNPSIIGWSHLPFGRRDDTLEEMIISVARGAIADAGISSNEIDATWLGHFNSGLVADGFPASLTIQADEGLRWKPATRVENACASGSAAIYNAINAIKAGDAEIVLVVGAEKMTNNSTADVAAALGGASYQKEEGGLSFPQIFAQFAQAYFDEFGDHSSTLATIAAKNHANGVKNPLAHMRKDVGFEFCNTVSEKNPIVADPLRVTDCSLISDGAAAIVIASDDVAKQYDRAVRFRSTAHVQDVLPMSRRKLTDFEGPARAFGSAFDRAGIQVDDLDFAEIHDCFTIAELLVYEAMGLAPKGKGASALEQGTVFPDGDLPINLSGGLKAKGHPVGATGVSMHVMSAMQLNGEAGDLQKADAELGCVFNMGGSGVANYCSILERRN